MPVKHATLVFCDNMLGLYLGIVTDLYAALNLALMQTGGEFSYDLASAQGKKVRTIGGVDTVFEKSIADIQSTDLVMVPSVWGSIDSALEKGKTLIPWLIRQYEQGAILVAHGTAVIFLAESGLLDGKSTTLYWQYFDEFEERYPNIQLNRKRYITSQERIFCSNGLGSSMDLGIYLIEKIWGPEIALIIEKQMLVGFRRGYENELIELQGQHYHADDLILSIQQWMEVNFNQSSDLNAIAKRFAISERSLKRRFKAATGESPLKYMQRIRMEKAKDIIKHSSTPISQVGFEVGYEDVSYFSKLFKQHYDITPTTYRELQKPTDEGV